MRYRPIIPVRIQTSINRPPIDTCIDSAADDTVFPPHLAMQLGIDLSKPPGGAGRVIGGVVIPIHYSTVTLLISDGYEAFQWDVMVPFSTVPMRWALLGHSGFLEYFDVQLLGANRELTLFPNQAFPGTCQTFSSMP